MKRILIIEDQADIRELIRLTLELEAWEIHEAGDGPGGFRMARELRPDLVLLDVMMPGGLDGFQVCECLRADPATKRTKIVMLTARTQPEDLQRGLRAGADAYLSKPFSPRNLIDTVNRLL